MSSYFQDLCLNDLNDPREAKTMVLGTLLRNKSYHSHGVHKGVGD